MEWKRGFFLLVFQGFLKEPVPLTISGQALSEVEGFEVTERQNRRRRTRNRSAGAIQRKSPHPRFARPLPKGEAKVTSPREHGRASLNHATRRLLHFLSDLQTTDSGLEILSILYIDVHSLLLRVCACNPLLAQHSSLLQQLSHWDGPQTFAQFNSCGILLQRRTTARLCRRLK